MAQAIARQVPEVVPLIHSFGCGRGGADHELHNRTLQNLCRHPNLGGVLIVGLGREILGTQGLEQAAAANGRLVRRIAIQQEGGSRWTAGPR